MNLTLTRQSFNTWGVISQLTSDDGSLSLITLEHAYNRVSDGAIVAKLVPGTYTCKIGTHQLKSGGPFQAFEILGVPNCSGILFHCGNYNADSEGCVLLGTALGNEMILNSKIAFDQFMTLQNGQPFTLTVV